MSSFHCSSFIIFATFFIFVYIYHFTSRGVLLRILMPFLYRSTTINICIIKNAFRVNVATAHVSHLSTKIQVWSSANYEVRFNPSLILDVKGAFRQHRFHFFLTLPTLMKLSYPLIHSLQLHFAYSLIKPTYTSSMFDDLFIIKPFIFLAV